jgi:hypothetical protein
MLTFNTLTLSWCTFFRCNVAVTATTLAHESIGVLFDFEIRTLAAVTATAVTIAKSNPSSPTAAAALPTHAIERRFR